MTIQFATADPKRAETFIRSAYPTRDLSDKQLEPLLELVREGVVRVQDPKMHGGVGIIPGDDWDGDEDRVKDAARALEEAP